MDSLITLNCSDGKFLIGKRQLMATSQYFENQLTDFPNTQIVETVFKVEEWENLFDIINSKLSGKFVPLKIDSERYIKMISYYDFHDETFFRNRLSPETLFTELKPHTYFFHMKRSENGKWKSDNFISYPGIVPFDEMPGYLNNHEATLEEIKERAKTLNVRYRSMVYYWNITVPGEWYQIIWIEPSEEKIKNVFLKNVCGRYFKEKWIDEVPDPEKYDEE